MPRGNYTIQRSCEECGKIFTPPTLVSKYCCPACSKRAYKKRQIAKEKEAIRQALIRRIPSSKGYLTVKEAMLISYDTARLDTVIQFWSASDTP